MMLMLNQIHVMIPNINKVDLENDIAFTGGEMNVEVRMRCTSTEDVKKRILP